MTFFFSILCPVLCGTWCLWTALEARCQGDIPTRFVVYNVVVALLFFGLAAFLTVRLP